MPGRIEVQGHRGARGQRPENTLPSFEAALDACVDSIETDLALSRDGVLLVHHDLHFNPMTCRPLNPVRTAPPRKHHPIREWSFAEMRQWVADQNPDRDRFPDQVAELPLLSRRFADEHGSHAYAVPTLNEVLAFLDFYAGAGGIGAGKTARQRDNAARVLLDLELKSAPFFQTAADVSVMEAAVLDAVHRWGPAGRCRVRSFDHRVVARLLRADPTLGGAVLVAGTAPIHPSRLVREVGATLYCPDFHFLDAEAVTELRDAGLRVVPWTVNDPEAWARLLAWGVDGITTDYPARLGAFIAANTGG